MSYRTRMLVVTLSCTLLAGEGGTARAQELPPGITLPNRPSTTEAETTTTTATTVAVPAETTTTAPPPGPPVATEPIPAVPSEPVFTPPVFLDPIPGTPAAAPAAPAPGEPAPGTGTTPAGPSLGAAEVEAILGSMQRSGASSTAGLLAALRTLEDLGFDPVEAAKVGFGQFPVAGLANYRDDFYDYRAGPPPHPHQGNDIFAAFDTPTRAPVAGVVSFSNGGLGGKGINLAGVDGNVYYFAHMNGFADLPGGAVVGQGDVIGFVGDTGNARGGTPHVHFEIRPGGGAAVNPKPILDRWLADAEAKVDELIATFQAENPRVLLATGQTRQFDLEEPDEAPQQSDGPQLWAASVNPVGSALRRAEIETARLAPTIDWEKVAAEAQRQAMERHAAVDTAHALLGPLTPPVLERLLGGDSE